MGTGKTGEDAPKTKPEGAYVAVVGITYPTAKGEQYAKPGTRITDLPERSVKWLLAQGLITAGKES